MESTYPISDLSYPAELPCVLADLFPMLTEPKAKQLSVCGGQQGAPVCGDDKSGSVMSSTRREGSG